MPPEVETKRHVKTERPHQKKLKLDRNLLALPSLPFSLQTNSPIRNDLSKLRQLIDQHGFRTSIVHSPREALSIYKDSFYVDGEQDDPGKEFLMILFGLHPSQDQLEQHYATHTKSIYSLRLFCQTIQSSCAKAMDDPLLNGLVHNTIRECDHGSAPLNVPDRLAQIITDVLRADPTIRGEQLQNEYQRIQSRNATLSNAHVQLFLEFHEMDLKDIYWKRSPQQPQYERITIYLYDPEIDELRPPRFTFLPALHLTIDKGPEKVASDMVQAFFQHLLRRGYFCTEEIRSQLSPNLLEYFLSGLSSDLSVPTKLNAHFDPTFPLSLYLHGPAGAGKSSLAKNFSHAMYATLEQFVDPETMVRFVKQNLNKRFDVLQLEFDLRPNNNDLSVMGIIQSRQMMKGQSKPGLVVIALEELARPDKDANPNQLETLQLICQRFSGRKGAYTSGEAPRNSEKRGISGDCTIIPIFTSNYELLDESLQVLKNINMFKNILTIRTQPISGNEREEFASSYIGQCVADRFAELRPSIDIQMDIPLGNGDTRPLVRNLRMLSFYVCATAAESLEAGGSIKASILQRKNKCRIISKQGELDLRIGSMENIYPVEPVVFDPRTGDAIQGLKEVLGGDALDYAELSTIIDFWLAKTLAPTVIISNDLTKIKTIVSALGALDDAHGIRNVDASEYKMMKSLYDSNETPNLRDDILKLGRGALVAVELLCETLDAQLCIREMIEDTPSMTAFSSDRSALYKAGLFFGVFVKGEITPELRSRASLIL